MHGRSHVRQLWGYAPDENLSVDDMLKVKYQVRGAWWGLCSAQHA
jgi:cobalamin-dependent methionine synthase I